MNGKKNLLAVLILITAIVALFLGIDAQKTKDRKEKATKVVVDEGVCRPEGFKNRWLQTIGKNINIEKNAEEQGKLILRAKEKVLRFRSQISVLCTNGVCCFYTRI